jgi:CubicO group peptidase (beta-lactamase class C family)
MEFPGHRLPLAADEKKHPVTPKREWRQIMQLVIDGASKRYGSKECIPESLIGRPTSLAIFKTIILSMVLFTAAACSEQATPAPGVALAPAAVQPESPPYWPTEAWRTSTPAEQGMDAEKLNQMMAFVAEHDIAIDSVVVVRNGYIVFEAYRNGYDQHTKHHIQSVTKSFTSMLIGIALQQGLIQDVSQRMVDFFPNLTIANMDARKRRITLEHLLTMSDGLDWHELDYPYADPRNTLGQMWASRDAVQHVLDRPMAREPGAAWAYNSGTSILLGGIIEQVTGRDVLAFAREVLFEPIGIKNVSWSMTTGNHYHTDGGLYLTPRDMARLGYLMLNDGTWDGKEIVSSAWVARSSTAHYQTSGGYGYGYQWWTLPGAGVYAATGHYEQKIYVAPEQDLVAVFTANIADQDPHPMDGMLYRFILAACTDLPAGAMVERYAAHGFTFDYPLGGRMWEMPFPGRDVLSDTSGMLQFTFDLYPLEIINVSWDTPEGDVELKTYLDGIFAAALQQPESEVALGESLTSSRDGHAMIVQFYHTLQQGIRLSGVIGVWYCDRAGRVYGFNYATHPETASQELLTTFQQYLASFACH